MACRCTLVVGVQQQPGKRELQGPGFSQNTRVLVRFRHTRTFRIGAVLRAARRPCTVRVSGSALAAPTAAYPRSSLVGERTMSAIQTKQGG